MVNRQAQVGLVFAVVLLFGSLAWAQTETPKVTPGAPPAAGVKAQNPTPAPMGQPQVVIQATPQAQAQVSDHGTCPGPAGYGRRSHHVRRGQCE